MVPPGGRIRLITGFEGPLEIADHHLSHAASAFYFSGFQNSAILTVDGVGEWPTTTYGAGDGAAIRRFGQVDFPHSLGMFYSAVTGYLGFEVNEGEYKVMGLAPYGEPHYAEKIGTLIENGPGGAYRLNLEYFAFLKEDRMFSDKLCDLLGEAPRRPESEIRQFHMDVARSAQVVLEEILLSKVEYLHGRTGSENLCMAGGVALNVVANSRCLREGPFKRLFVQPAAGDAGACLGAAAVVHARLTNSPPNPKALDHVYLGPSHSNSDVVHLLNTSGVAYRNYAGRPAALMDEVVSRLIDGQVIGWFSGRMEFGPRALGARSILADARRPEMKDRINAVVKQREGFRPFAPAVLEEFAQQHFALDHASPFMLETCQVISPIALPSITHVDGSARVQTVNRATNPRFAELLEQFHARTGCPILLNTSFNLRGEPIVQSPVDAVLTFSHSGMDTLVLEDAVIEQRDIPAMWRQIGRPDSTPAQGYAVYAMF